MKLSCAVARETFREQPRDLTRPRPNHLRLRCTCCDSACCSLPRLGRPEMPSTNATPLEVSLFGKSTFVVIPAQSLGGTDLVLHQQWVRERCGCSVCVEPGSMQPFKSLSGPDIPEQVLRIVSSELIGDALRCTFGDGHVVTLSVTRILKERAAFEATGALEAPENCGTPQRKPWTAGSFSLPLFEYSDLALHRDNPPAAARDSRRTLLETLLETGLLVVRGVPCYAGEVLRFTRALVGQVRETHWGTVFDVQSTAGDVRDVHGQADQAFSASAIAFHADNTYRRPMIDFQLLHCIKWEGREGRPGDGVNRFVDGLACAQRLRETDKEAFDLLCRTPVKWENDVPLISCEPLIQLANDGKTIARVFFSPKSGGFAPLLGNIEHMDAFFAAQRKLCGFFESEEFVVHHRLSPGDLVMFANTRVLHARTGFSQQMTRHLQGLYIDYDAIFRTMHQLARTPPASSPPRWASLAECSAGDVMLMSKLYAEDQKTNRVQRVLQLLCSQRGAHTQLGASVDLYTHGLQTATLAHRAGEDIDVVVGALLHDVGELYSPSNHGDFAAALLAPYISPAVHWCLAHHEIFQVQFYGKQMGMETSAYEQFRDNEHFQLTQRFCENYDQAAFDAAFEPLPLSFFTPLVEKVFSRVPYWHSPAHPKRGLVTGPPDE